MAASASKTKAVPIHFLCGSDEDAVKKAAAELARKLAPDGRDEPRDDRRPRA